MRSSMEIRGVDIVVIPAYQPPDTLLKLVRDKMCIRDRG